MHRPATSERAREGGVHLAELVAAVHSLLPAILDGRDGAAVGYFVEVFSAFRWCAPREMIEQSSTCLA